MTNCQFSKQILTRAKRAFPIECTVSYYTCMNYTCIPRTCSNFRLLHLYQFAIHSTFLSLLNQVLKEIQLKYTVNLPNILCMFHPSKFVCTTTCRILYCSTSSQYRKTFAYVASCGRFRGRHRGGNAEPSGCYRMEAAARGSLARSVSRRRSELAGLGNAIIPRASTWDSGSGTLPANANRRLKKRAEGERGHDMGHDTSPIVASAADEAATLNRRVHPHSVGEQRSARLSLAIELRPLYNNGSALDAHRDSLVDAATPTPSESAARPTAVGGARGPPI